MLSSSMLSHPSLKTLGGVATQSIKSAASLSLSSSLHTQQKNLGRSGHEVDKICSVRRGPLDQAFNGVHGDDTFVIHEFIMRGRGQRDVDQHLQPKKKGNRHTRKQKKSENLI